MYYLETNALRILSNRLTQSYILDKCYTSILSICEIISGIKDDQSFKQRQGIIKKVFLSNIKMDLDLPENKLPKAYGISIKNSLSEKIIELGNTLINSKSLVNFHANINNSQLIYCWSFVQIYDRMGDKHFKNSFKDRQDKFDYSNPFMIQVFNNRWNNLSDDLELRKRILNDLIEYFTGFLLLPNPFFKIADKDVQSLQKAYNHLLDIFFLCIGYFTGTKIIFKNAPSKNDYFDLVHLMYLRGESDIIVSNDNMLIKLMKKLWPKNINSLSEFEKSIVN